MICFFFSTADEENIVITNKKAVHNAAILLKVTEDELMKSLTQRVIAARGDIMMKTHNTQQAEFGRDALAKAIYDRLFSWIIQRINKSIQVPGKTIHKRFNKVIGVLDIYGFEVFDANSFEQFCINYCNEKLQQLFIGELWSATYAYLHSIIDFSMTIFPFFHTQNSYLNKNKRNTNVRALNGQISSILITR